VKEKSGDAQGIAMEGYSNFEQAPKGLDEEEDDEEDDIGRNLNQSNMTEKLDYDSPDEQDE